MSRRHVMALSGLGATTVLIAGCAGVSGAPSSSAAGTVASQEPVSVKVGSSIKLHMFQTGWVSVKKEHRAFSGPASLRFPAILASRRWTEWLPVTAFAIEHPEGLILVDTGETAQIKSPDYVACDPVTGMIYRRNLRFSLDEADELGPQMRRAGLNPDRVSKVVLTHLHSDHMGGITHFPRAEFLVSQTALRGHAGALMCRIPSSIRKRAVTYSDLQVGVFPQSFNVTRDGTIKTIPTPGHANGHQSVLIESEGKSLCIAGDAAFTLDQITKGELAGIVENVSDARATSERLNQQQNTFGTLILPTHDPQNQKRLLEL